MPPGDLAPLFVATLLTLVTGTVLIFRGPLGKALARRLEGSLPPSPEVEARIQDLETRIAEVERDRLELAERLEFTERMLLQVRETASPRELGR
jgi:hypothetical protein